MFAARPPAIVLRAAGADWHCYMPEQRT